MSSRISHLQSLVGLYYCHAQRHNTTTRQEKMRRTRKNLDEGGAVMLKLSHEYEVQLGNTPDGL